MKNCLKYLFIKIILLFKSALIGTKMNKKKKSEYFEGRNLQLCIHWKPHKKSHQAGPCSFLIKIFIEFLLKNLIKFFM